VPFQTPITIARALERIQAQEYVLPAIQREFKWSTDQVTALFDSLMRGYPIGSFLFWQVKARESRDYVFYGFIREYHELNSPHCPRLDIPPATPVTAILDGQQRLTSLLIGLRGSHAERMARKWARNVDNYPIKRLYLNLRGPATENEQNLQFEFKFLNDTEAMVSTDSAVWFPVRDVLGFDDATQVYDYLSARDLAAHDFAFKTVERLRRAVRDDPVIAFYEEEAQDLDKVLNIFIRVNSFGEPLSYSDLLLSIATAQWSERDARKEIYGLVDELNQTYHFAFSKDQVLKAGLVLADVGDVRFKVTNFNRTNMAKLEQLWDELARSIRASARLLSRFGFSAETLPANSPLVPLAYYIHKRVASEDYVEGARWSRDREVVREWVVRSLLKAGVWGSGLDTLLTALRRAISGSDGAGFPAASMEKAMTPLGKSLTFQEEEILDLADTPYGHRRLFALLSMLYHGASWESQYHIDHVFPKALFARTKLLGAGVAPSDVERYQSLANGLANLQLLPGAVNESKQKELPSDWATGEFPDPAARADYLARHDLHRLPDSIEGFPEFYAARRERIVVKLRGLLASAGSEGAAALEA
jgi:hypothetical protein